MTQENNVMGTVATSGMLLLLFGALGLVFVAVWTLIKIPIWLISPHRGGMFLSEKKVYQIPLSMVLYSKYFWRILLSSGVSVLFTMVYITNLDIPSSSVNTNEHFLWALMVLIFAPALVAVIYMICELIMILNFEKWFDNTH